MEMQISVHDKLLCQSYVQFAGLHKNREYHKHHVNIYQNETIFPNERKVGYACCDDRKLDSLWWPEFEQWEDHC